MGLRTCGWDVSVCSLRIVSASKRRMEELLGIYSRINHVSLVIESVFANPESRSFYHGQDTGFLAGRGAAFELAEALWVLLE
jgi:hypothetical protein